MSDQDSPTASSSDLEAAARTLRAVAHPIRLRALGLFHDADLSPVALARLMDEPRVSVGALAYHVQRLAAADLIALSQTIQRRGAVEHRYSLTVRGRAVARIVQELSTP